MHIASLFSRLSATNEYQNGINFSIRSQILHQNVTFWILYIYILEQLILHTEYTVMSTIFHEEMLLILLKAEIYFGRFLILASNDTALQAKRPLVLWVQEHPVCSNFVSVGLLHIV